MSNQNRDVEPDERAKDEDKEDDDDDELKGAAPRSGNRTIGVVKRAKGKSSC